MPSQVAVILCFLFILYIYKLDFKWNPDLSNALWIPLIWMLIIGSRLLSEWIKLKSVTQSSQAEIYLTGNSIDRNFFSLLIIVGIYILSKRKISWSKLFRRNIWILIFILYSGFSITWSDFPIVSLKRWFKAVIGNIIMALVVLTEIDSFKAVKSLIRRCAYVLIPLSIVFIKYFPYLGMSYSSWTGEQSFVGVTSDKNMLGVLCLVCGLLFFSSLFFMWRNKNIFNNKKKALINILFLLMIFWLMRRANSATSLICLIIGICIIIVFELPILKRNIKYIEWYIFLIILFCFFSFLLVDLKSIFSSAVGLTGHSTTFWGRTELWKNVLNLVTNTLFGAGFESFWLGNRLEKLWASYWWRPNMSHNGYIEIYINLGLIGLFLLIMVILASTKNINKTLMFNFNYGRFRMAFLIIALFYNITEGAFRGLSLIWFIFLLTVIQFEHL